IIKLKVVVELAKKRPTSVWSGNSVSVSVDFPCMPPKCGRCEEFGHLELSCPTSIPRPNGFHKVVARENPDLSLGSKYPVVLSSNGDAVFVSAPSPAVDSGRERGRATTHMGDVTPAAVSESKSLPSPHSHISHSSSSGGWIKVIYRSKPEVPSVSSCSMGGTFKLPITNAQFSEELELINTAQ
ncbi:unnamed protein product, partial [Thlaspi arvense]